MQARQLKDKARLLLKYGILALVVGVSVGMLDTLFGRVLILISDFRSIHYRVLLPFLPLAGLLIVWMYHKFSALSLKGMTLVFETAKRERDAIPLPLIPLVMIGTWLTHLFGGSAGREGVAVQLGATLSHWIGRKLKLPDNGRVMLITGMAAGFAGLFQTPLTAVFFAMEVVVAGLFAYEALFPALIAAFTASYTSHLLGLGKFSVAVTDTIPMADAMDVVHLIILGIAFGLTGACFSILLSKAKALAAAKVVSPYKRIGLLSIPLVIILFFLLGGRYCGLGTNLISESFYETVNGYDFIVKLLLTVFTLAIGFQGGEVTPLFSIGATLGACLGGLLGISPVACAALGYAAVFGSATNTLLAPILIGVEVFGGANMAPFVIVCAIAYLMNGDHSIYSAQLSIRKGGLPKAGTPESRETEPE